MQNVISKFDYKNIPQIVDTVLPIWTSPEMRPDYARLYAELILRSNIFDNDFALQLQDGEKFCSAAFAVTKGEQNNAHKWLDKLVSHGNFSADDIFWFKNCITYIEEMDKKLFSYMSPSDIQLSLFVSRVHGSGKPVLQELFRRARARAYKNVFLWTDCECDWEYYPAHGFELLEQGVYDLYSKPGEPYKTYFFKKAL